MKTVYDSLARIGEFDRSTKRHKMDDSQQEAICKLMWKRLPAHNKKDIMAV